MLAETAKLAVELSLTGNLGPGVAKAEQQFASLNRATAGAGTGTSRLSGAFSVAGRAASGFGGALTHAQGQLKGLLTGPLGILGLTGGLLGFGGAIESSLAKTSQFSLSLERMTGLTGESAQSMGELILVAQKFGVESDRLAQIVGFTEKRLGLLQNTSAAAAKGGITHAKALEEVTKAHEKLSVATQKLSEIEAKGKASASQLTAAHNRVADADRALIKAQNDLANASSPVAASLNKLQELGKQYGVVLTDSRGKALDFSTTLNHVADFYSSNATAANKAALASQVFGRGFAVMIPILQLGSKGIKDAKQAVEDLGLSLGTDTQGALAAYKSALRGVGEAIDVLQISIGLALAPAITELANNITLFLEHGGAKQIVSFFKQGAQFASDMGHTFMTTVVPVFGQITAAWNAVPGDIRALLIGGFIANKAVKWTFGIDLVGGALTVGKDLAKGFIAGLGKSLAIDAAEGTAKGLALAGLGKLFVQPVFVTNWAMMGGLGALGGAGAAAGIGEAAAGIGLAGIVSATLPLIAVGAVAGLALLVASKLDIGTVNKPNVNPPGAGGVSRTLAPHANAIGPSTGYGQLATAFGGLSGLEGTLANKLEASRQFDAGAIRAFNDQSPAMVRAFNQSISPKLDALRKPLDALHQDFATQLNILRRTADPQAAARAAARIAADVLKGVGSAAGTKAIIAELQKKRQIALDAHDHGALVAIDAAIRKVESKLPNRTWVDRELALGAKIAASNERQDRKISDLTAIQRVLRDRGDTHAAGIIKVEIQRLKDRLAKTTTDAGRLTAAAIAHKKSMVNVNIGPTTIPVTVNVSARQVRTAEVVVKRYGNTSVGWT